MPLTPLATRLCDALETLATSSPQLAFVSSAMRKQMARSPIGDEEILSSLAWVQEMIQAVIVGQPEDLEALYNISAVDGPDEFMPTEISEGMHQIMDGE